MSSKNPKAKSIRANCIEEIPLSQVCQRVKHGEIIVVSSCLQAINCFDKLQTVSLEGIRQAVGEAKADQIRKEGFEAVHKIIDIDELDSVVNSSYEVFRELAPFLARELVRGIFQTGKPFYVEEYPNVRFHVPYDAVMARKEEFNKFYWNGKVTAHGPHHDSWYYCPTNCINIWIAIGKVTIGNGLNIYPQVYGRRLPCTENGKILQNQYFGQAVSFELEPGDAVIFHGEHLHSSEINSTDSTRYVVSLRMTVEKPQFLGDSPYKEDYIYAECNDNPFAKLKQSVANRFRLIAKYVKLILNRNKEISYIISPSQFSVFDDTSADFPKPLPLENGVDFSPNNSKLVFDCSELPVGSIKPISEKFCIARIDTTQTAIFSRRCPHEGADLAAGYLRDGCVVCPWHNLPLNLESGKSPCKSLSQLTVCHYVQGDNDNEWQEATSLVNEQGGQP